MRSPVVVVAPDLPTLAELAAARVAAVAREAVAARGIFRIALSGGDTPRSLHAALAAPARADVVPWTRTQVFWGDDRHVPPDHPDSNYRMAAETLLALVPIDPSQVFRIPAEREAAQAADEYEGTLVREFGLAAGQFPRFDLMIMGIGTDGHTASLFPDNPALREEHRLVAAPWVDALGSHRITMTLPVINNAAHVMFLVAGEEKAAATAAALDLPDDATPPPAALVRPARGELVWLLDAAAARLVEIAPETNNHD